MRCPIHYALDFFGDRWSLLLIRDMLLRGKRRYTEFLNSEEGISTNILANRLKQMQERGLLEKFADPRDRKAAIYLMTDKGARLAPILIEVIRWGLENDECSAVPDHVRASLTRNPQGFTESVIQSIAEERAGLQQP